MAGFLHGPHDGVVGGAAGVHAAEGENLSEGLGKGDPVRPALHLHLAPAGRPVVQQGVDEHHGPAGRRP
eukprot:CAMPEP_0194564404 /NCGR_PEP_ID=MMETSP0292-20121207/4074_1 /TAXON_ID=39354 /ORGANISM="Heterosigma akashiwo, Strain CCMP2393" /LENGTH=68 /DNA_ID=CAMNT_0039413529 /DNA_START=247 /DNA_END=450 /DNA_ORIENTATION=-